MINYILPGLYEHFRFNKAFLEYLNNHQEQQEINTTIHAVYGNFQFCIWDGGRIFQDYKQATLEDIKDIFSFYTDHGIISRLIFTNNQLKSTDYYDRFCNLILTIGQDYNVEIVLADEKLMEYIKTNYPNYKFISSTTKCITNFDTLRQEINNPNYKMVCLDYNLNKHKELINFTPEEKEKTEFLCNAICPPGCTNRKNHYRLNSLFSLSGGSYYSMCYCPITNNTVSKQQIESKNNITLQQIKDFYVPNGFSYFKLEGRTLGYIENLCNYINYLIKPEYKQECMVKFNDNYFKL